ncbi:ROK family protein [Celeribacter halophilus]|uniref:ROK family protein n=1 Tax=Celeribacter halophilus TaxID=576117 RepID=UPI002090A78A|nr:ROK family protein [Celeribacter halophilus]MDO6511848.1 ROK family protein [Celeribacter halophilus]
MGEVIGSEMKSDTMICGGIDLGGTKIEARLFEGAAAQTSTSRRIPTPTESYESFLDGLGEQIEWLLDQSGTQNLPIGIAVPGVIDPQTQLMFAANIVATGQTLGPELKSRYGRNLPVVNDCMAFTLSEAHGGAGDAFETVVGLILGTGLGAGVSQNKTLLKRHGGLAVEIGHSAAPATAIARHDLPLFQCGCGRIGCLETYISGTGLSNIAEARLGKRLSAETVVKDKHQDCLDIWADITGECLVTLQMTLAPDCIVLGGGLSNMPHIVEKLNESMAAHAFSGLPLPELRIAQHGDSSGARGAALMAVGL